jgi:hypothetical protein
LILQSLSQFTTAFRMKKLNSGVAQTVRACHPAKPAFSVRDGFRQGPTLHVWIRLKTNGDVLRHPFVPADSFREFVFRGVQCDRGWSFRTINIPRVAGKDFGIQGSL